MDKDKECQSSNVTVLTNILTDYIVIVCVSSRFNLEAHKNVYVLVKFWLH